MSNRRKGFSLIEAIVASMILAVGLVAAYVAWLGCFNNLEAAREASQAGQLGRALMERAKLFGIFNLPTGNVQADPTTGAWAGSFDPATSTWTSTSSANRYVYQGWSNFDVNGNPLPSPLSPGAKFAVSMRIVDYYIVNTATGYTFDERSKRCPVVTVITLPSRTTLLTMGTTLVAGGS